MVAHSPRAFPWETEPPVGNHHVKGNHRRQARPRRRPSAPRTCLNKGCGRKYQPRCYHQRYCQDPECQRELNRWRSASGRRNVARTATSKPSTPRQKRRAASEPSPRPRPFKIQKLHRRVVTQHKVFFPSVMQSAGLPRTPRELDPQPGSLLLPRLPAGRSQCPGS